MWNKKILVLISITLLVMVAFFLVIAGKFPGLVIEPKTPEVNQDRSLEKETRLSGTLVENELGTAPVGYSLEGFNFSIYLDLSDFETEFVNSLLGKTVQVVGEQKREVLNETFEIEYIFVKELSI